MQSDSPVGGCPCDHAHFCRPRSWVVSFSVNFLGEPNLELVHVPIPLSTQGSTLMTVAQRLTDVIERGGRATGVALSHNRDLTFSAADVRYVDYTEVCPREWFTRRELAGDIIAGRLGRIRPHYARLFQPAIDAVEEMQPKAVLVYDGHYAAASMPLWERVRGATHVVLYVHNTLSRTYGRRELERLFGSVDHVVFCSEHLRRATERRLGRSDERLSTVANGVDPAFLVTHRDPPPTDNFEIVYAGRVVAEKGVHLVLRAAERATALTRRRLSVRIIGSSNYRADGEVTRYERSLRESALRMSVPVAFETFVPHSRLRDFYLGAGVACMPSLLAEGMPLAPLEAMATGLPVIVSDSPGMLESVLHAGVVTPQGDVASIARAIAQLADDAERWAQLSELSLERAMARTWESAARELSAVWTA